MYDYVIVGAGSAGCVLAARLSEDPDVKVCLLEAGGPDTAPEIHMPAAFPAMFKSGLDWDLEGEQEPGMDNRRIFLPRGKMLGGSSSINAMIYIRGNRADYDEWAAGGAEGWGYDDVLPYFKRAEDNERGADMFHGVGGPLSVSEGRSNHALTDAIIEAAVAAGHERNPDFNGARQEGVGRFQVTQRNGLRCSTAVAYLHPAMARPNLEVITGALTHRVLFDDDRAVGVEISRSGGAPEEIRAEREVILSAGAYQTPVIMMLSGIGPAADLEAMMIPVRENLPVGENLQDHPSIPLNFLTDEDSLFEVLTPENITLLETEGRGPLSSNIAEAGAFMRTRPGLDAPDVQFHFVPGVFHDEGLAAPFDHGYAFGPVVLKPTSRGKVSLRGLLPDAKPRILHNYLMTEEDRASAIEGTRIAMQIADQAPLKAIERERYDTPEGDSDEELLAFIRRTAQTVYHPTSTCAIGEVVDSELRVMGVPGLRVVDASVMPSVVRGNTNAPTIMVAEKAADLIKG